jgi:hypothetical protein
MTLETDRLTNARTELVWAGKRTQVDRVALPFQRVETVNAPRGADLFSLGQHADGWRNKLIWGDNKLVMASLLKGDDATDGSVSRQDRPYLHRSAVRYRR